MLEGFSILMPAGLRLRTVRPLPDRSGCCTLLYDFERSILIEVPEGFHHHLAAALETGDLDEDLLAWLAEQDVLTFERRLAALDAESGDGPVEEGEGGLWTGPISVRDVDLGAGPGVGQVLFGRHRVVARLGLDDEGSAVEDLGALLQAPPEALPLTLLLGGEEPVRRFDVVRRVVAEAHRSPSADGREIAFAITVDPAAVTRPLAAFLADHRFEVRAAAGAAAALAAAGGAGAGLRALLDRLPERVTVHAALGAGDRLRDLWRWVRRVGVRRFDASREGVDTAADGVGFEAELRRFRNDLFDLCDDLHAALEEGRTPPLYQPVVRTVRRLAAGRPLFAAGSDDTTGCLGLVTGGRVVPLCGGRLAGRPGLDAMSGKPRGSAGADGRTRAFRRAEIEVALLFYSRLRAVDATCLLGSAADGPALTLDAPPVAGLEELKVC